MSLNDQYFKTRKEYREARDQQKNKKLSLSKKIRYLVITLLLVVAYSLVQTCLTDKIEANKANDFERLEK